MLQLEVQGRPALDLCMSEAVRSRLVLLICEGGMARFRVFVVWGVGRENEEGMAVTNKQYHSYGLWGHTKLKDEPWKRTKLRNQRSFDTLTNQLLTTVTSLYLGQLCLRGQGLDFLLRA